MTQLGESGEYRARVWEYGGQWHVAIETKGAVDNWYELSLGVGGKWWQETYSIYHLHFANEQLARTKAKELLDLHRVEHDRHYGPIKAKESAEVIV